MSYGKRTNRSARSMTAIASAVALALGTLSLAGCGNDDDDLPPVDEAPPTMEQQGSPMQDATTDPGIDQTDTASGDGSADPVIDGPEAEEPTDGSEVTPDQDPLPEAEQEPMPEAEQEPMLGEEELEGEQPTMNEGNDAGSSTENDEQS